MSDKLKKEKSPVMKITTLPLKKVEVKKTVPKKEELATIPKSNIIIYEALSFGSSHTKISTGITTGTQSSKQLNPSITSLKNSPKASIA